MVKDERNIDKFDRAFAAAFEGLEAISLDEVLEAVDIPADWLEKMAEKHLSEEEQAEIEALGGFDKLMETLRERLKEQQGRHQGGSNGSAPPAPRPSAPMATTPKACGSARRKAATSARSRSGTSASSATSTTRWSWARATSRWR